MNVAEAFEALGIPPTDDWDEISRVYRRAAKEVHPDTRKDLVGRAAELLDAETRRLTTAKELLQKARASDQSLVDQARDALVVAEPHVGGPADPEDDPFYMGMDPDDVVVEAPPRPRYEAQWPPHGAQWPSQPVWKVPPRRSPRWRAPVFLVGLALAAFCRWASTRPDFTSGPDDHAAALFWMYVGLLLMAVALVSGLRRIRAGGARRPGSWSRLRNRPFALLGISLALVASAAGLYAADRTGIFDSGVGDECLVGAWTSSQLETGGTDGNTLLRGGAGAVMTITPDGRSTVDFAGAAPLEGDAGGSRVEGSYRGSYTSRVSGKDGRLRERDVELSSLGFAASVDGIPATPGTLTPGPPNVAYQCGPSELTVGKDVYVR